MKTIFRVIVLLGILTIPLWSDASTIETPASSATCMNKADRSVQGMLVAQ